MGERMCEASGYTVRHCKAIDLCDCFDDGAGELLRPDAFVVLPPPEEASRA